MIALLALWLAPPVDDPTAADLECHRGTWAVVRSVRDGMEGPAEVVRSITRVVEGDRIVWKRDGEPFAATRFTIDPEADPKAIDLIPEGGPHRGERVEGIYKFEDDALILCVADPGQPRPSAFEAGPGSGASLYVLRRVEPVGDEHGDPS